MLYPVSQAYHTLRNAKPAGWHSDSCSVLFKAATSVVKAAVSILSSVSDHIKLRLVTLITDENSTATQSGNVMGLLECPL